MKFTRIMVMSLVIIMCVGLITVTADAASKPDAPVVEITNIASNGKIKLSWDSVDSAKKYSIYMASSKSGKYTKVASTTDTCYTYSDADVGQKCYFYVKSILKSGTTSAASNKVYATAKLPRTTVTLSNSEYSGKIKVSWKAVSGAEKYLVYRATSKNGTYTCINSTTATSFTNVSTTAGKTYYYKVKAVAANSAANSAFSAVKYRACDLARPVVTLSNVTSSGKIKISWEAIDGAVGYEIFRSTDKVNWKSIGTTTSTSRINTGAKAGTVYYYRIKALAKKSASDSAYSVAKYKTCKLARPTVTLSNDSATGRVMLSWSAVDDAIGYRVYRSTSKSGTYTRVKTTTDTSYIDTTGKEGETYYYKVVSDAQEYGADSAYSTVKSGKYTYLENLNVSVALNEEGYPRISWNEVENGVTYKVYRSLRKTTGFSDPISTTSNTYIVNRSVAEGITYYYTVKALNSSGTVIKTSNVISFNVPLAQEETPVTRYLQAQRITLYELPDSTSDSVTLRYMDTVKLGRTISTSDKGSWSRVFYNNKLYYMWQNTGETKLTATKSSFEYVGNTVYQQEVIDLAMDICNNWETVYEYGQSTGIPKEDGTYGFVCSGYVKYVLNQVMQKYVPTYKLSADVINLYETDVVYNGGYKSEFTVIDVDINELQPGDVLFFNLDNSDNPSEEISHCGIYMGNNEFVHASDSWADSICVMPLTGIYEETFVQARRYLPESIVPVDTVEYAYNPETNYNNYKLYSDMGTTFYGTVPKGAPLTVLFSGNGSWVYVRTEDNQNCYIHRDNLSGEQP